jgi:hypothetical protein
MLPIRNLKIVTSDGTEIFLVDPKLLPKSSWKGNIQIDTGGNMNEKGVPLKIKTGDTPADPEPTTPEPAKSAPAEPTPAEPKKPGGN